MRVIPHCYSPICTQMNPLRTQNMKYTEFQADAPNQRGNPRENQNSPSQIPKIPILSEVMKVVTLSEKKVKPPTAVSVEPAGASGSSLSVVVKGVFLRCPTVFVWVGLLGFSFQSTAQTSFRQSSRTRMCPFHGASIIPTAHVPSTALAERNLSKPLSAERGGIRNVHSREDQGSRGFFIKYFLPDAFLSPF